MAFSKELLKDLQQYVNKHLITKKILKEENICYSYEFIPIVNNDMEDFVLNNKKPSFNKLLFSYIDKLGVPDSEIYKKAGIDRRLFSKIRSNSDYHPSKNTALALAFALRLEEQDAQTLLGTAGYTLSDSETFDLVITFCFQRKIYDINDINIALNYFSLKPLSGAME